MKRFILTINKEADNNFERFVASLSEDNQHYYGRTF